MGSLRTLAGCFGFSGDEIEKRCRLLSGGERVRLVLARMLYDPPNFLVLDEPTNHLDLATKEMLIRALAGFEGTLLLVSHDRRFLAALTNRVLELGPDGPHVYGGGYARVRRRERTRSARACGGPEMVDTHKPRSRAVLLGVQLPDVSDAEFASSLAELARLAKTLGLEVVGRVAQRRSRLAPGAVVGEGQAPRARALDRRHGRRARRPARARGAAGQRKTRPTTRPTRASATPRRRATPRPAARPRRRRRARAWSSSTRPHALAGAQPRARDRRRGARPHGGDPRDLPAPRAQPRGAPPGGDRAAQATWRRACARPAAAATARAAASAAAAPARARASSSARKVRDRIAELRAELVSIEREAGTRRTAPERAADGRARRLHERRQVVLDARAHRKRRARRGQAVRDARHHRARAPPRDRPAHPRVRHGGLHQEAAPRPRRELPLDARRGARRRPAASTWSTPRTRPSRRRSR